MLQDPEGIRKLIGCMWDLFTKASFIKHREVGKRKTIVIVAEGAHDSELNPIKVDYVKDVLANRLGLDTRVTCLGHTQRGGRPCAADRVFVSYVDRMRRPA